MRIAAGLLALSSCVHTPELPRTDGVGVGPAGDMLAELVAVTDQVQRLVDDELFMKIHQTPAETDRFAFLEDPRGILSLSGHPYYGNPDKPGCRLEIDRTSSDGLRADFTQPDSKFFVGFYPENPRQNLRLDRTEKGMEVDSIDCNESVGVTNCTYSYVANAQNVPPDMVSDLLAAADSACNAFRQAQ